MALNLQDLKDEKSSSFLFVGEPGTGKSIQAASFPNCYIMSTDRRTRALQSFYPDRKDIWLDVFYDLPPLIEKVYELVDKCPYNTIILDSVTKLGQIAINHQLISRFGALVVNKALFKDEMSKKELDKSIRGGITLPSWDEYGGESQTLLIIMDKMLRARENHGCNVIFTAHRFYRTITDKFGKQETVSSIITGGKLPAAQLPVDFNEIYQFRTLKSNKGDRFLVDTRESKDISKCTLGLEPTLDVTEKSLYSYVEPCL